MTRINTTEANAWRANDLRAAMLPLMPALMTSEGLAVVADMMCRHQGPNRASTYADFLKRAIDGEMK